MATPALAEERTLFHTAVDEEKQKFLDSSQPVVIDGSSLNPRHTHIIGYTPKLPLRGVKLGFLDYLDQLIGLCKDQKAPPPNYVALLEQIADVSHRLNNRYLERILEDVRMAHYQSLPSRTSCMYLADSSNIEFWHEKALEQLQLSELPIYEMKARGSIHYADADWLDVGIVSDDELRQAAHHYWSGKTRYASKENMREILFAGTLTVVKKHRNLTEYRESIIRERT